MTVCGGLARAAGADRLDGDRCPGGRMHSRHALPLALPLALALLAPARLRAQETPSDTLLTSEHYLDWEQVADPQIAPDGSQIVYTRRCRSKLEDTWDSALWIMNADGSHNRFLIKGDAARWSPDGARIVYVAEGEPKGTQIFVRWMDAEGATSQVTRLQTTPASVRWSPDGRSISFATLVTLNDTWRISMPQAPTGANWTHAPRLVDRLHYRQDRRGFKESGPVHLFLWPADGGIPRQLTHSDWKPSA